MPVGFNFNLTFGLKPQVGGIKLFTVYNWRSIFQVEWLITTLIVFCGGAQSHATAILTDAY